MAWDGALLHCGVRLGKARARFGPVPPTDLPSLNHVSLSVGPTMPYNRCYGRAMNGFGQSTEETGAVDDTQRSERDSAPVPQDRATNVDVSIIMPCLNEELSVGECVQKA